MKTTFVYSTITQGLIRVRSCDHCQNPAILISANRETALCEAHLNRYGKREG